MVRADPSLLGESKALLLCRGHFCLTFATWFWVFSVWFLRFFCECIIWEIEYGRDWDCGGFLRDCSQTNSTDWFKQQLRYLNPRCGPLTSHTTLTIKFDFLGFQTLTGKPSHAAIIITFKLWRVGTIPSFLDLKSDGNNQRQTDLDRPLKRPQFFQSLKRHWSAAFPSNYKCQNLAFVVWNLCGYTGEVCWLSLERLEILYPFLFYLLKIIPPRITPPAAECSRMMSAKYSPRIHAHLCPVLRTCSKVWSSYLFLVKY